MGTRSNTSASALIQTSFVLDRSSETRLSSRFVEVTRTKGSGCLLERWKRSTLHDRIFEL